MSQTQNPIDPLKRGEDAWPSRVIIHTDGASRGNPGPASLGIVVLNPEGQTVFELGEPLGNQTNNFAEYSAVLRALQLAVAQGVSHVTIRSDSELLVRQLSGIYKVKSPTLAPLFQACQQQARNLKNVKYEHVRREFNVRADELANQALDSL